MTETLPTDNHVHSQFSWDAFLGDMERTCERAVRIGLPSRAFTEHADFSWSEFDTLDEIPVQWHPYVEGTTLMDMIREDLVAERVAIDSYGEMIRYLGNDDPTTRRMLEGILAKEEEHAVDLKTLIEAIGRDEAGAHRS